MDAFVCSRFNARPTVQPVREATTGASVRHLLILSMRLLYGTATAFWKLDSAAGLTLGGRLAPETPHPRNVFASTGPHFAECVGAIYNQALFFEQACYHTGRFWLAGWPPAESKFHTRFAIDHS